MAAMLLKSNKDFFIFFQNEPKSNCNRIEWIIKQIMILLIEFIIQSSSSMFSFCYSEHFVLILNKHTHMYKKEKKRRKNLAQISRISERIQPIQKMSACAHRTQMLVVLKIKFYLYSCWDDIVVSEWKEILLFVFL